MALSKPFLEVIALLGVVFDEYQRSTGLFAVLVGGAAVTLYTQGRYVSGDFDIVAGVGDAFDLAMKNYGFIPTALNVDSPGKRGVTAKPSWPGLTRPSLRPQCRYSWPGQARP
jgi:hypothetical protein